MQHTNGSILVVVLVAHPTKEAHMCMHVLMKVHIEVPIHHHGLGIRVTCWITTMVHMEAHNCSSWCTPQLGLLWPSRCNLKWSSMVGMVDHASCLASCNRMVIVAMVKVCMHAHGVRCKLFARVRIAFLLTIGH
jgi:hypothetical protein